MLHILRVEREKRKLVAVSIMGRGRGRGRGRVKTRDDVGSRADYLGIFAR